MNKAHMVVVLHALAVVVFAHLGVGCGGDDNDTAGQSAGQVDEPSDDPSSPSVHPVQVQDLQDQLDRMAERIEELRDQIRQQGDLPQADAWREMLDELERQYKLSESRYAQLRRVTVESRDPLRTQLFEEMAKIESGITNLEKAVQP